MTKQPPHPLVGTPEQDEPPSPVEVVVKGEPETVQSLLRRIVLGGLRRLAQKVEGR